MVLFYHINLYINNISILKIKCGDCLYIRRKNLENRQGITEDWIKKSLQVVRNLKIHDN